MFLILKKRETGLFFIFYCVLYSLLADLIINPVIRSTSGNAFIPLRIYTIVEFTLVALFLKTVIKSVKVKKGIQISIFLFVIYAIIDLYISKSVSFDSIPSGVSCILTLLFSIYYLYEQIRDPNNLFLYSSPHFWIVVGLIIYFSGTFFVYIFSQSNYDNPEFKASFTVINASFIILRNLLFSIAFIIKPGKEEENRLKTRRVVL